MRPADTAAKPAKIPGDPGERGFHLSEWSSGILAGLAVVSAGRIFAILAQHGLSQTRTSGRLTADKKPTGSAQVAGRSDATNRPNSRQPARCSRNSVQFGCY